MVVVDAGQHAEHGVAAARRIIDSQRGDAPNLVLVADELHEHFAGIELRYAWRAYYVAAQAGSISAEVRDQAEAAGWVLIGLPNDPSAGVPTDLIAQLQG